MTMMSSIPFNDPRVALLRQLHNQNPVARALFTRFAGRDRDTSETSVERAMSTIKRSGMLSADELTRLRAKVVVIFKWLAEHDFGQFIPGRGSKKSRIAWSISLKSLGNVATGFNDQIDEYPITGNEYADATGEDVEDLDDAELVDETELLVHEMILRPDLPPIEFELPADLTREEAMRIAHFARSLPFNNGQTAA